MSDRQFVEIEWVHRAEGLRQIVEALVRTGCHVAGVGDDLERFRFVRSRWTLGPGRN